MQKYSLQKKQVKTKFYTLGSEFLLTLRNLKKEGPTAKNAVFMQAFFGKRQFWLPNPHFFDFVKIEKIAAKYDKPTTFVFNIQFSDNFFLRDSVMNLTVFKRKNPKAPPKIYFFSQKTL